MAPVGAIIRLPFSKSRVPSRHRWTQPSSPAITTSSTRYSVPVTWRQRCRTRRVLPLAGCAPRQHAAPA